MPDTALPHIAETRVGPLPCHVIGNGPIHVLAVHGLLVDSRLWTGVADQLRDKATFILPNFPFGSHATPVPDRDALTPENIVGACVDLLDALGVHEAMLLGNDSGGALCQMAAAAAPERFTSLTLTSSDAFEHFPPKLLRPVLRVLHLPGVARAFLGMFALKPVFAQPSAVNLLVKRPVAAELVASWLEPARHDIEIRRDLIAWAQRANPRYTLAAAEALREYHGPTMIAWSREDKLFPATDAERLNSMIPNTSLVWVEDALTFSPLDQPAAVAHAVSKLIDQITD